MFASRAAFLSSPYELSGFFAGITRWALREDVHRILLVTSEAAVARVARLWFPISTPLRFIYHAPDPSMDSLLGTADHLWECIDNDFDLA